MKTYTREQLVKAMRAYNLDAINEGWEDLNECKLEDTEQCAMEQVDYLLSKVE